MDLCCMLRALLLVAAACAAPQAHPKPSTDPLKLRCAAGVEPACDTWCAADFAEQHCQMCACQSCAFCDTQPHDGDGIFLVGCRPLPDGKDSHYIACKEWCAESASETHCNRCDCQGCNFCPESSRRYLSPPPAPRPRPPSPPEPLSPPTSPSPLNPAALPLSPMEWLQDAPRSPPLPAFPCDQWSGTCATANRPEDPQIATDTGHSTVSLSPTNQRATMRLSPLTSYLVWSLAIVSFIAAAFFACPQQRDSLIMHANSALYSRPVRSAVDDAESDVNSDLGSLDNQPNDGGEIENKSTQGKSNQQERQTLQSSDFHEC